MRVGLGVALYASEEYDEAIKVLCEAVDLAPNDPKPLTFLGMARRVSPELAQQVDDRLEGFAERYPENPAANYEYAMSLWDRKGGEEGKNLDQIEKLLRKAIATAPEWFEPHYQLGLLYESELRYVEAIRETRRASALEPAFRPAHFRLAGLYKRIGDKQHAALEAVKARQLDNDEINSSRMRNQDK
jgi:tetratricopeptide (TPR) repeat protein